MNQSLYTLSASFMLAFASISCQPDRLSDVEPLHAAWNVDYLHEAQRSTNQPFVLATVVDETTGRTRDAAVAFGSLQLAVMHEHGLSVGEANNWLRRQRTRRIEFGDPAAVKQVWPRYSLDDLKEVRVLLRDRTPEQIVADQADLESTLNIRSRETKGEPYGYLLSVLHVLLERGVSAGASCKPGLVYLDEGRRGTDKQRRAE